MEQLSWSPRRRESAVLAGAGLLLCGLATATDSMGRFLVLVAGLGLLAAALHDVLVRPRLRADAAGLAARSLTGTTTLAWGEVAQVRVDERHGMAVRSTLLEIDAGETLIMLGRRALGTDPHSVADALCELRDAAH